MFAPSLGPFYRMGTYPKMSDAERDRTRFVELLNMDTLVCALKWVITRILGVLED